MKIIFPIISIVVSVGIFLLVGRPLNSDVNTLKNEVKEYNLALSNSMELEKTRDSLIDIYKNITPDNKNRLDLFLPNNASNIELILEIQKIAKEHNLSLNNIKFDVDKTSGNNQPTTTGQTVASSGNSNSLTNYGVFNLDFSVSGDYETFVLFLKDLENNLRLINVKSISFSGPQNNNYEIGQKEDFYTFQLSIDTYWFKS